MARHKPRPFENLSDELQSLAYELDVMTKVLLLLDMTAHQANLVGEHENARRQVEAQIVELRDFLARPTGYFFDQPQTE